MTTTDVNNPASTLDSTTLDSTGNAQAGGETRATAASNPVVKPVATGTGPLNLEQIRKLRLAQVGANTDGKNASRSKSESQGKGGKQRYSDESRKPKGKSEGEGSPLTPELSMHATSNAGAISSDKLPIDSVQIASGTEASQGSTGVSDGATAASSHPTAHVGEESPRPPRNPKKKFRSSAEEDDSYTASAPIVMPKVEKPNIRRPLSSDLEMELESALIDADLNGLMIGAPSLQVGVELEQGSRRSAKIIKIHQENVFLSLGGPDEGIVPLLQFTDMPQEGASVEVLIRGFNAEDGLYELALPGEATSVEDWEDVQEGLVVEVVVESANTGGLECKVGGIRGFIPMRQISEYRVEETASYIGQRLLCVVMEANQRRGNLVLSHRAVLERDRAAQKVEKLASLNVGDVCEGTVRKVADFGAFVDIGGLDGLIHVSQLSWDRIKHPSEVVKEGDQIQVRIEKIDPASGKIGLSYRAVQDHPWADVETLFPVGTVVKGVVSRIAAFGAFVKIATGVEGLVHVSELAHRRIATVNSVVQEGQEVEAKVLSVDREAQRMSLSLKAIQEKPASENSKPSAKQEEVDEPQRAPVVARRAGPLKGGTSGISAGEQFGLKW
jgi:small subunit ribosomal protein S1